jgi:hypothetical protein
MSMEKLDEFSKELHEGLGEAERSEFVKDVAGTVCQGACQESELGKCLEDSMISLTLLILDFMGKATEDMREDLSNLIASHQEVRDETIRLRKRIDTVRNLL